MLVSLSVLIAGGLVPVQASAVGSESAPRQVDVSETWEQRDGRLHRNGQWVFLKHGKLLRAFENSETAEGVIADLAVMIDQLGYNSFCLNIYPDQFDANADGWVDPERKQAHANFGRIFDYCWRRGVFCSLSFETYNVGGGGTPIALFIRHNDIVALNALGEPARDVEYGGVYGKYIPSIFNPAYLEWSRNFICNFLRGLSGQRAKRLLFIETTVEPQYLGRCSVGDRDPRRAFLDFSEAARTAFLEWQASWPAGDPHRTQLSWPVTQAQRDQMMGNRLFNDFRAHGLANWINGDIGAIRSVIPDVYVAVDYNGRFDDPNDLRLGTRSVFLDTLSGVNIIQIAPHVQHVWTSLSWDDVVAANARGGKNWAISEHMTATGSWGQDDEEMTGILEDTLARGTRWGWEFVNAGNRHATDDFHLYHADWTGATLDVIEGGNRAAWQAKIGAPPFVPVPRDPIWRADLDADGDVDQEDFGRLQACFSDIGVIYPAGCDDADQDMDRDVDVFDYLAFQSCMSGPGLASACVETE